MVGEAEGADWADRADRADGTDETDVENPRPKSNQCLPLSVTNRLNESFTK